MKKVLALVLCLAMALSVCAICVSAETTLTWKDGWINDPADENPDDGQNLKFDNAYGYTFAIEADKVIGGEDNALIETEEEYKACNPNWAISVLLAPEGDVYKVVKVVATPGSADNGIAAGINFENGNVVLVAHSAYSHAEGANYESKLCALALKEGDKVEISADKSSVYVLIPGADDNTATKTEIKNVASGKSYTTSLLYRQGGADVNWAYDENAAVAYPDEDGVSLTDGVFDPGDNDYKNVVWAGFSCNCPDYKEIGYSRITVDLGEQTDITKTVLYVATSALTSGIGADGFSAEVFVSDDNENWTSIGSASATDDANVNYTTIEVENSASARYVQVRMNRGGWMFVSEVEVYAEVEVEDTTATVKETITVDGVLDDNGWASDKWVVVNGDNGFWQQQWEFQTGAKVCPDFEYKYQLRADDTKLYAAVVIDGEIVDGGNGNGTFVRFWVRDNDEATVYTSFYDFGFADGAITTAAKYNTSTTTNAGAVIEGTTVDAKASVVGGNTVIEFSIDIAEFSEDGNFDYYICASQKVGDDFGTLYYPAAPIGPTSEEGGDAHQPHANLPWLSWHVETDATVNVADIALGEVTPVTGDAGIYAIAALALVAMLGTAVVIKKRA